MWDIIVSGGPVMVPLIGCAILAVAFAIERFWVLSHLPSASRAKEELDRAEAFLLRGGKEAVVEACNRGRGVLNYVLASLVKRHDALLIEQREFQQTHEEIIRLAEIGGGGEMGRFMVLQQELADLKSELMIETQEAARGYLGKNLPVLNTIANISTLLGLLGTITGMIKAFNSIAASGAGDPRVVAGGISEALVTTAAGLIIAIPTVVAYRYLARRADRSLTLVEVYGHAFANTLIMSSRGGRAPATAPG
ncbi:MAG: MotA/TolQ/ExbB proton channel family protein [Candidatus Latescibacterota bacterium]